MGNSRFSDGFLLGALIGGVAVFLLGTKKGNKVLHAITEEGLDGFTDLIDLLDEKQVVPRAVKKTQEIAGDALGAVEDRIELESPSNGENHKSSKRFFKKK